MKTRTTNSNHAGWSRREFVSTTAKGVVGAAMLGGFGSVVRRNAQGRFQTVKYVQQIGPGGFPSVCNLYICDDPTCSEPDTEIEPHLAIDPNNPSIVVAAFQQSRFADAQAAAVGYATSQDGGKTWPYRGSLPGLTQAAGGPYKRATDPWVAFGPDGKVYVTTLAAFQGDAPDRKACAVDVVIHRSDNGGITFNTPSLVQDDSSACQVFNDNPSATVDTFPQSPHYGRIYVVWLRTTSVFGGIGAISGSIVLRFSDDYGQSWSSLVNVQNPIRFGIGPIVLVRPNGDVVVAYFDLGTALQTESARKGDLVSQRSRDGGVTFEPPVTISAGYDLNEPADMRTDGPYPAAAVDPITGTLYACWQDKRLRNDGRNDIVLSRSADGSQWSDAVRVNHYDPNDNFECFTPGIAAYGRDVHIAFSTRRTKSNLLNTVEEHYVVITDDASLTFGDELVLGPNSDLKFAAYVSSCNGSNKKSFLGDYIGVAASADAAHVAWCRSSTPPGSGAYHQTTWSATILK